MCCALSVHCERSWSGLIVVSCGSHIEKSKCHNKNQMRMRSRRSTEFTTYNTPVMAALFEQVLDQMVVPAPNIANTPCRRLVCGTAARLLVCHNSRHIAPLGWMILHVRQAFLCAQQVAAMDLIQLRVRARAHVAIPASDFIACNMRICTFTIVLRCRACENV